MMQPSCKSLRHKFLVTSIRKLVCIIYSSPQWAKCSKITIQWHCRKSKIGTTEKRTAGTESCERLHCFSSWAEWRSKTIQTAAEGYPNRTLASAGCSNVWDTVLSAGKKQRGKTAFAHGELPGHCESPNSHRNPTFFHFKAAIKCVSVSLWGRRMYPSTLQSIQISEILRQEKNWCLGIKDSQNHSGTS